MEVVAWVAVAIALGALGYFFGVAVGRRGERDAWISSSVNVRGSWGGFARRGDDYVVMKVDTFLRNYHNPLVRARRIS